jgi:hypothetical protein
VELAELVSDPDLRQRIRQVTAMLEVVTDPRIERYWQLTAIINQWPPFPSPMAGSQWLLAALRAHQ